MFFFSFHTLSRSNYSITYIVHYLINHLSSRQLSIIAQVQLVLQFFFFFNLRKENLKRTPALHYSWYISSILWFSVTIKSIIESVIYTKIVKTSSLFVSKLIVELANRFVDITIVTANFLIESRIIFFSTTRETGRDRHDQRYACVSYVRDKARRRSFSFGDYLSLRNDTWIISRYNEPVRFFSFLLLLLLPFSSFSSTSTNRNEYRVTCITAQDSSAESSHGSLKVTVFPYRSNTLVDSRIISR